MRSLFCLFLIIFALLLVSSTAQYETEDADALIEYEIQDVDENNSNNELIEFDTADEDEFDVEAVDEAENDFEIENAEEADPATFLRSLRAPPKQRLSTRRISLGDELESVRIQHVTPPGKFGDYPVKTLPRQMLSKQHGPRLGLMRLPRKVSAKKEHRPVKTLAPLPPRKLAPQYRQQVSKQEVIQPIVSIQPMLHQRVLTRTIMQPTLQKQPVVQRIITQPILRRTIREQPITQQQIKYQNIVQTRRVTQPEIKEELKVEKENEKQQTVESMGPAFPRLTAPPKSHA